MRKQYHDRYAGLVPDRDIEEILRTHWADPTRYSPQEKSSQTSYAHGKWILKDDDAPSMLTCVNAIKSRFDGDNSGIVSPP